MPLHQYSPSPHRRLGPLMLAFAAIITLAAPAAAQYGSGPTLIVDPVRVPIDGIFDAFGSNCPGAATVVITLDDFAGTLADGIASDDSFYIIEDIAMPNGVVAGHEYTVRAACSGQSATFLITAVCNDGADPVDGVCEDGKTVGGETPTDSTTTTTGSSATTTVPGGSTTDTNQTPNLAVTGAALVEQLITVGATLVATGFVLMLMTSRRREVVDEA